MTIDRNRRISRNWGISTCAALALAAGAASAQTPSSRPDQDGVKNNENQSASDWYSQASGTGQYVQPSRGENTAGAATRSTTVYQDRTTVTTQPDPSSQNRIYGTQEQRTQTTSQGGWQNAQTLTQIGNNDLVLVGEKNNKTAEVVYDDGQLISYTLDGKTMPLSKVQSQGNRIRVLDENNQVCASFNLPQSITSGRFGSGKTYGSTTTERRYNDSDQDWRDHGSRDQNWRDSSRDFRTDTYQSDRMGNNDHYQPADQDRWSTDRSDTSRTWDRTDRTYNQYDRNYNQQYQGGDNSQPTQSSTFDRFYGDRQQSYSPSRLAQNYRDTREQSYPRDQYTRDRMSDNERGYDNRNYDSSYNRQDTRNFSDSGDNRVWNPQTQSWEYRSETRSYSNTGDNRTWNPQTQSWEYRTETRSWDRTSPDRTYDRSYNRDTQTTVQQNRIYGTTGAAKPMVLGIMMEDADQSQISSTQYSQGVKVTSVQAGLPADTAGLKANDIIVMVDNQPATVSLVRQTLSTKHDGDQVSLKVLRDNQPKDITVKLSKVDRKMYNWDYMGDIQKSDEFTDTNIENLGHPGPYNNYRPTQPEPNYGDTPKSGSKDRNNDNR